mmetsp:Transcript_131519/g.232360  ORF Transcript_131519/g.232360 Transcript_131519/m.232360 type:complete len:550 (+) Transcript_131519:32-1681(+)
MGGCLEGLGLGSHGPSHNSWNESPKNKGQRTVICVAGLASSALVCEERNLCGRKKKKVSYCSIDALATNPLRTLASLECTLVEGQMKDGSSAPTVADRRGCKITPVEGTAGIRTLNPGEEIPVSVWDGLIDELEDGFNLWNFAYDWRRWGDMPYVETVVDNFKEKVETCIAKDCHESKKASIIAHSMGAPVVLYCINQLGREWQWRYLDQIILVAPAMMGSPIMIPSFAHAPFVATMNWLPMQNHIEHSLGDLCSTWPCMLAEMPMLVGEHAGWPDNHVFACTPTDEYKMEDIGRFLEDLCGCQENREIGKEMWPNIEEMAKALTCPAVPVEVIYGKGVDTPNSFEYRTPDIGAAPLVKSNEPGDGTIVADSVTRIVEKWREEGMHVGCFECPGEITHKELIINPFTIAVIEKLLEHEPLQLVHVEVIKAKNLQDTDFFSKSDPYCQIYIPGRKTAKHCTQTIYNNLNPEWYFTTCLYHWQHGDEIRFAVYDADTMTEGQLLGKATMPTQLVVDGFEGCLDLIGSPGTITVKVWLEKYNLSGDGYCVIM